MSEHRNIVFVVDAFTKGGAQRNIEILLPAFMEMDFKVSLILIQSNVNELNLGVLQESGITIIRIDAKSMFDLSSLFRLRKIFKCLQPAYIFSNLYWSQIWSSLAKIFYNNLNLTWIEHNTYLSRNYIQWVIYKLCSYNVNQIYAVSSEVNDYLLRTVNLKSNIIRNCVMANNELSYLRNQDFTVLFAGRLIPQKNPELAIKVFIFAVKNHLIPPDSKLIILGEGELMESCKVAASISGLSENIKFFGFVDSQTVSEVMSKAHCLLMTSKVEGSPLVRIEALSNGMTIVTTRTSGISGILTESQSNTLLPGIFVIDSFNIQELAIAIHESSKINFWTEQEIFKRYSASTKFNPAEVANLYLSLINSH